MDKKIKKIVLLGVVLVFFLQANFVLALEIEYPSIFGFSINSSSSLPEYVKYFFNIGMAIAGVLTVIIITFGGIYYLVSLGRGSYTGEGKEWIKAGITGLLLIISSYLIAYTINPYLVVFDLKNLAPISFLANYFKPPPSPLPIEIYNEIPIGTLTENLLAGTTDCYNYDGNGDPIEGDQIETDNYGKITGPTYLEHDRIDCFLKLSQAAEKKAKIVNNLSNEITNLMEQCSCQGTCDSNCNSNGRGCAVSGKSCTGACVNGICKPKEGNTDCCPTGVKDKIEKGPIKIPDCNGLEKEYKGLDEFRSQFNNDYNQIKNNVEIQPPPKIKGKPITVIKNGNCQVCSYQCPTCDPNNKDYSNCQKTRQECQQNELNCQKTRQECLYRNSPWYNLRLIDQLTYLKGKLDEIKQKVQQNLDQLKKAESLLGQCYIADTYIDFLKTYEQTNKKEKVILIERSFFDSETNQLINPAKYCQGFQYNNSSCYSQCQKICPGTEQNDFDCYKNAPDCPTCDPNDRNYSNCIMNQQRCLTEQSIKVKECFNNRGCILGASPFGTFKECFTNCKQQCLDSCNAICPGDNKNKCLEKCNSNSQCLLNNEDKCLMNFNKLKECTSANNDLNFLKSCANNATLCKYCSDQYAGYPECLRSPYSLQDKYSSSFIYQNPNYQICSEPYKTIVINNTITNCLNLYPETAKCPSASKCPQCPCDITSEIISSSENSNNDSTLTGSSKKLTEYKICSGTCDDFAYNDDPLTFYCQQSWWLKKSETKDAKPIGSEKICPKEREIPIGRTVDDAENWGQSFMDNIDTFTQKVQDMVQYMKNIGQKKDYCKCDSKCEDDKSICHTDCRYNKEQKTTTTDPETGIETTIIVPPSCSFVPCSGNPCQMMIDFLQGASGDNACAKQKGIEYYYNQISISVKDFITFIVQQGRSDVVKGLNYSRKKTNECSVIQNNYGIQTRVLSCTRVENEILSPTQNKTIVGDKAVNSYCYGKALGEILKTPEPMADNWFCCENRIKE